MACSLDGHIADREGSVDWLNAIEDGAEDYGLAEFMRSLDGIVMGSRTYEFLLAGSDAKQGLITEFIIAVIPVLLAGGTPLLEGEFAASELDLLGETSYPNGIFDLNCRSMPQSA